jgi:hypothetical protein
MILSEPIIIRNSRVPKLCSWTMRVYAITLFPFVFIRDEGDEITITHETIHHKQYLETLVLGFLFLYLFDFVYGLIKYRSTEEAYFRIRFEQEAYANDIYEDYLEKRRMFSWLKYKV